METWIGVAIVLAFFVALSPQEALVISQKVELELKKLWLLFRVWPMLKLTELRIKFILWRARNNKNNRTKQ